MQELFDAQSRLRRSFYPDFFVAAKGLISAFMETLAGGDSNSFDGEPDRKKILVPLGEANIVGSELISREDPEYSIHKPVLDIDMPLWVKESTTPGHFHLIIDKEMTWRDYRKLLITMQEVGILEKGFVDAAISRKASWIRTPWTQKEKDDDDQ